jgi:hypothetical protein
MSKEGGINPHFMPYICTMKRLFPILLFISAFYLSASALGEAPLFRSTQTASAYIPGNNPILLGSTNFEAVHPKIIFQKKKKRFRNMDRQAVCLFFLPGKTIPPLINVFAGHFTPIYICITFHSDKGRSPPTAGPAA